MAVPQVNRILYLHGFASGPTSKKAAWFRDRFAERGIAIEILDLAEGDFEHLTISRQLDVIGRAAHGDPVSIVGSSLGGYLAALYASLHPETDRLVLMAPAFNFAARFRERLGPEVMTQWQQNGKLAVPHHSDGLIHQLHYGLIDDAAKYEAFPDFHQPAVIFHGRSDDVVPPQHSATFAERHPNVELHFLDSGHELLNVLDPMWRITERFLVPD